MNNQYWKSDRQISRGVSPTRVKAYKDNVASYKPLTLKQKLIPFTVLAFIITIVFGGFAI